MLLLRLCLVSFAIRCLPLSAWGAPSPPSQAYLTQQALDEIASRAAPISGESKRLLNSTNIDWHSFYGPRFRYRMLSDSQDLRLDGKISRQHQARSYEFTWHAWYIHLWDTFLSQLLVTNWRQYAGNYSQATQDSLIRFTGPYVQLQIRTSKVCLIWPCISLPPADVNRCQEHSILQSLNEGIRVFDLRLAYNPGNDTIGFYHCEYFKKQQQPYSSDNCLIII